MRYVIAAQIVWFFDHLSPFLPLSINSVPSETHFHLYHSKTNLWLLLAASRVLVSFMNWFHHWLLEYPPCVSLCAVEYQSFCIYHLVHPSLADTTVHIHLQHLFLPWLSFSTKWVIFPVCNLCTFQSSCPNSESVPCGLISIPFLLLFPKFHPHWLFLYVGKAQVLLFPVFALRARVAPLTGTTSSMFFKVSTLCFLTYLL